MNVVDLDFDSRRRVPIWRWIACSERMPSHGRVVETKHGVGNKARCFLWMRWIGDRWMFPKGGEVPEKFWPTHWSDVRTWIEGERNPWMEDKNAPKEPRP